MSVKYNVHFKCIIWVLFVIKKSWEEDMCPNESYGQIFWPDTSSNSKARSTPLCLSENMEILERCCDSEGNWKSVPTCSHYQKIINNPCPDQFDWNNNICIFVIENSVYPPQCPYVENLPFFQYLSVLNSELFPVWMPVERKIEDYGIDLIRWSEPTAFYKTNYNDYYYYGTITDKNCLIYHNSSFVQAVSCNEKHTAICAYQNLPDRNRSFCSQSFSQINPCVQSNYSSHSKCFCKGLMEEYYLEPRVEFLEPYQNLLYSSLNERCYIGLQNINGSYLWRNSNTTIKYSNWYEQVIFSEDLRYGIMTSSGWIVVETENVTSCVLYEANAPSRNSEIFLYYTEKEFVLELTNPSSWVFEDNQSIPRVLCFTDAVSNTIISNINITSYVLIDDKALFYFQKHPDGPGNYWCEAFPYPDVAAKSSNKYLLSFSVAKYPIKYSTSFTEEYVVLLRKKYAKNNNPISESSIQEYQQLLANQIQLLQGISHFQARIYKISVVDEDNITINFHVGNPNQSEPLAQYPTVRTHMEHNLIDFTFVQMLAVDRCIGFRFQGVTWPSAPIYRATKPKEGYCIRNDGSIMNRQCFGNYIDGANWLDLDEPCAITQLATNTTVNLTNIINLQSPEEYIQQVVEISRNSNELIAHDVELISHFLSQVALGNNIDVKATSSIVNQIMEVTAEVLEESQDMFNATDRILFHIYDIINQSNYIGEIVDENFFIISYYVKDCNLSIIALQDDNGYYKIHKACNSFSLSEVLSIDNLKVSLILSENLITNLQEKDVLETRIIITIYKDSSLFNEIDETIKKTDLIIGVTFPYISEEIKEEIYTVYSISNSQKENSSCCFWDYKLNEKKGHWAKLEGEFLDNSIMCTYNHPMHFSLVVNEEVNITRELETLIYSPKNLPERLDEVLELLTNYYMNFQSVDIELVSQMLYLASEANENNLNIVVDIINKMIDIPKEILETSQQKNNATGKILIYFGKILEKSDVSQTIQKDNVYVVVRFLREQNLYGFTIDHCNTKSNFTLLDTQTSVEEVSLNEKLDVALIISHELLSQLLSYYKPNYIPKIITTVFFKSSLFIEDYAHSKITTIVVGVFFPNFDDGLNGDLSVLYKLDAGLNFTCSVYQSDNEASTFEKGFWNSEGISGQRNDFHYCEFWKPSYFALLYDLPNVTSNLETILNSNENIETVLNNTNVIVSGNCKNLQPIDLHIIAQILTKVKQINYTLLEIVLNIVNNIMNIPSAVLRTSQEIYNATNVILLAFNSIAVSYNKNTNLYKDNIALVIFQISESNMNGIALQDCAPNCSVKMLYYISDTFKSATLNQFDVELRISSNLIDNLIEAESENYIPRVVFTVFFTDVLFVEKSGPRNTGQVFRINFPNYDQTLSSEISLTMNTTTWTEEDYVNCVSWISRENNEGFWSYESRPRSSETIICNFYEQNYFTVLESNTIENITQILESVLSSDMSLLAKLYKTQDVSYYYLKFQPYDVCLLSDILLQCKKLSRDGLDMVNIVINNILHTPIEILLKSGVVCDGLRQILLGINHISNFEDSHQFSLLSDQFGLVVCQLNPDTTNAVILTTNDIKCTYEVNDTAFVHAGNVVAGLILSKEIVSQATQGNVNSRMIVTVFSSTVFFNADDIQLTAVVLGLSIPSIQETLEGDIVVLYNNSIYDKSKYDCGYWENLDLWKTNSGKNIESFIKCNYAEATYFTLFEKPGDIPITNITEMLRGIINGNYTSLERLLQTEEIVSQYSDKFKAIHIYLVSKILARIQEVDLACLNATARIINIIMNISKQILADSQEEYSATDWILFYVDRIAEKIEGYAVIETDMLVIKIANNITGIFIEQCDTKCNIEFLFNDINLTSLSENINMDATLVLGNTLGEKLRSNSLQLVVTVYFTDALFNEGSNVKYTSIAPIIGVVIPSHYETLDGSLKFYYYTKVTNPEVCALWNYETTDDNIMKGHWEKDSTSLQPTEISLCESHQSTHFALLQSERNVTNDLETILNSNSTVTEKLENVAIIITEAANKLEAVDIYLISKILEQVVEESNAYKMNITAYIISNLFHVPRHILRESQIKYYATDKILHSIEEMVKKLNPAELDPIILDNFTVAIYDLHETNISGLLLENCTNVQCSITVLEGAVNLTEIVGHESLQNAIALSEELLNQVRQSQDSPKLVVTIYFSDVLFNEQLERDEEVSMVCGVLLPGFEDTFLGNMYVIFNSADNIDYNNSCAFWNFQMDDGEELIKGSWKSNIDSLTKEQFTICEYDHITHFALLIASDNSSFAEANRFKILDIITAVNSILSVIGIFSILLTAALFERWRRNTGNQILVHFSIAISLKMIMLYVSAGVNGNIKLFEVGCYITGAILHYAILSEFCWMLIIAILQFKRFVEVLGGPPKFVLLKACICGWVFPLLPVALILVIDKENYTQGQVGLCYPSGLGLYLGIWLPIIIIVTINFVIFIFIIYNVFHKKTETRDLVNHEILFQWRLALLLFSMLGLTWLFGFMALIPGAETVFVCLFCIFATLQGFIMFLFFIVFNQSTRFLYSQAIKLWLYSKGYKIQ